MLYGPALAEHVSTLLSRRNRLPIEERRPVAVLFIDVDHFKRFNDALGHAVGDALLVEMACRIVAGVDQHAYRIGGDEFVAVVDDVLTTGASLHEVARVLKAAGALTVTNLVLARTPKLRGK